MFTLRSGSYSVHQWKKRLFSRTSGFCKQKVEPDRPLSPLLVKQICLTNAGQQKWQQKHRIKSLWCLSRPKNSAGQPHALLLRQPTSLTWTFLLRLKIHLVTYTTSFSMTEWWLSDNNSLCGSWKICLLKVLFSLLWHEVTNHRLVLTPGTASGGYNSCRWTLKIDEQPCGSGNIAGAAWLVSSGGSEMLVVVGLLRTVTPWKKVCIHSEWFTGRFSILVLGWGGYGKAWWLHSAYLSVASLSTSLRFAFATTKSTTSRYHQHNLTPTPTPLLARLVAPPPAPPPAASEPAALACRL